MKLAKTQIALAVSLFVGLGNYVHAAWWNGDPQDSTVNVNGGSITITHDVNISTDNQSALWLQNGANVTVDNNADNIDIKITVDNSTGNPGQNYGILADGAGVELDLSNAQSLDITNSTWNGYGIRTDNGAKVTLGNNVNINQTNDNDQYIANQFSHAILVGNGATLTLGDDSNLSTNAGSSSTIFAGSDIPNEKSMVEIGNNNKFTTHGERSNGIHAEVGSEIALGDSNKITVNADGGVGLFASVNAKIIFGNNNDIINYGGRITGTGGEPGAGSGGILAQYNSEITLGTGNKITTYGSRGHGLASVAGSTVTAEDNTNINVWGEGAVAIFAYDNSKITLTGKQIIYSDKSFSLIANGVTDIATINADGLLIIGGDIGSRFLNDEIDLTFHNGSAFTGASYAKSGIANSENYVGNLTMDMTGTRWNMTDTSHVTNLTMDNSHVYFSPRSTPFAHLNIANLKGIADGIGGIFHMRSFVETGDIVNGGSGTNQTDKIIVTGTDEATGKHQVIVADRGGAITNGKETITIIETQGGDHEFTMDGYNEQGAYLYGLRRVEGTENNWELYGTGIVADTPKTVIDSIGARYRLGLHENQTLLQRLGDLRNSPDEYGAWVKLHGGDIKGKTTTATAGYELDYFGVQLGVDKKLQDNWLNGDMYLGLWGGYTKGDLDYRSTHTGDIKNYFVGLYATYMDEDDAYADLVLKYAWNKNSIDGFSTQGAYVSGSDHSHSYSASLEVGQRFHLERNQRDEGFYFEPQAQLSLTHFGSGDMNMSSGLKVKNESFDSLVGRLGVNLGIERKYGDMPYNAYVKVSYLKELDGDVAVSFNNADHQKVDFGDDWWTYGVGVTAKLSDKHSIYMDIERSSASDLFKQSWRGNVGYRYEF